MSIENITIEQKKIIIAGLLALKDLPIIKMSDIEHIDSIIRDFLVILDKLRFYSLDFDLADLSDDDIVKEQDNDYIHFWFYKFKGNKYIHFADILLTVRHIIGSINNEINQRIDNEETFSIIRSGEIGEIERITVTQIIEKIKSTEFYHSVLSLNNSFLELFRKLIYLESGEVYNISTLKKLETSKIINDKQRDLSFKRSRNILRFLFSKPPLDVLDLVKDRKRCLNMLVEIDYIFCTKYNLGGYKKDLSYLKAKYRDNLSRCDAGRYLTDMLLHLLSCYLGECYAHSVYDESSLDILNKSIPETWIWKHRDKKHDRLAKAQELELAKMQEQSSQDETVFRLLQTQNN